MEKLHKLVNYSGVCRERFRCLRAAHLRVSLSLITFLFVASQLRRGWIRVGNGAAERPEAIRRSPTDSALTRPSAGFLPTVGCPSAVALASYFPQNGTFVILSPL